MMRKFAGPATCLLIAGLTTVVSATVPQDGTKMPADDVYRKLTYVGKSGDLLGMAVEIRGKATRILVAVCEGGCTGGREWDLHRKLDGFSFTTCDPLTDQNGRFAPCQAVTYVGQIASKNRMVIQVVGEPATKLVLTRVAKPQPGEIRKLACMDGC